LYLSIASIFTERYASEWFIEELVSSAVFVKALPLFTFGVVIPLSWLQLTKRIEKEMRINNTTEEL
jgi:hypothetical protein